VRLLDWFHALRYWRLKPVRAILSGLGIVCGIAGLVIAVAIGQGLQQRLDQAMRLLGSGMLIVRDTTTNGASPMLTADRVDKLRTLLGPYSRGIAPVVFRHQDAGVAGRNAQVRLIGTDARYGRVFPLALQQGRLLTALDTRSAQRVCVIGAGIAHKLFNNRNILNRNLRIGDDLCRVVGWLKPNPISAAGLSGDYQLPDIDNVVYLPYTAMSSAEIGLSEAAIRLADDSHLMAAESVIRRSLIGGRQQGGVEIILPVKLMEQRHHMQRLMQRAVFAIAVILLLVGGIGIMNVMLMGVNSRSSEIGLRRSLGATRRDIVHQFLTEALVLAVAAGLGGIIGGALLTGLVGSLTAWQVTFNQQAALIGLLVSLLAGVMFGTYPAYKAAGISPVRALRAN
jgi:putative ABC transport system permease protein